MQHNSNDLIAGHDASGNPVGLPFDLLNHHVYISGQSGKGKSKFMEHLLRELIRRWPWTREGMLVIDPHAELYDSLVAWMAASGFDNFPVIPFDLRSDWICSLNILRPRPGDDPAPLISDAVRAILHGWKQSDSSHTPRLTKWLTILLTTLYESRCTLLESLDIIRSREFRSALALKVEDVFAKSVWTVAGKMTEASFQEELESTMNRLGRFLATQVLRLAFSQSDVSIDMRVALEKGHIVLASLSTEKSRIAQDDAAVVGSLLVNEVWNAANNRGKRSGEQLHRRFIVAIDEFQEYVSPVIAQSLAQLRGMNVGFIMAHQSPQQLLDAGPAGQQVLNAALSNAATQVFFQTRHPADLELLTPLVYRSSVNVDAVKHQHYATKVLDYQLKYHDSTSESMTKGAADTENWSSTDTVSRTQGLSATHSESRGIAHARQRGTTRNTAEIESHSDGASHADSAAESEQEGAAVSQAAGHTMQRNKTQGETRQLTGDYDHMKRVVGDRPTASFDAAYTDKEEDFRPLDRSIVRTNSNGELQGDSTSSGLIKTTSASKAKAAQDVVSHQDATSRSRGTAENEGETETVSLQSSDAITASVSESASHADMHGGAHTDNESHTTGITRSPMLIPVIGKEALPPQFRPVEEQLFKFSQQLNQLPKRQAVVSIDAGKPVVIMSPTVEPGKITEKGAQAWTRLQLKKLAFALPTDEAIRRLDERRKLLEAKLLGPVGTGEPTRMVRRIKE